MPSTKRKSSSKRSSNRKSPVKRSSSKRKSPVKRSSVKKNSISKFNVTKRQANGLYRLMKFIHDIFMENGIEYWITGGTLLGAIRHGGIIPHDDDGDICCMLKYASKIKKLIPIFAENGYNLTNEPDESQDRCTEVKGSCSWFITQKGDGLGVDIFMMKVNRDQKVTFADPHWEESENGGQRCYFKKKQLYPLRPIRFGNFFMFAPNNSIEHLNTCYNKNWAAVSKMLYNHREGKWVNGKEHDMKDDDYSTIAPPKETCTHEIPEIKSCKA